MKKVFKYTISWALAILMLMSCEEALLDLSNPNAITTGTFWQTKDDFNKAQNALYSTLQFPAVSGKEIVANMVKTDFAGSESWYGNVVYSNMEWTNAASFVINHWSSLYTGVYRANQILYYLEEANVFSESEKELIMAQCKFIRAMCYFWISNSYGDAVLHKSLVFNDQKLHQEISSRDSIVAFIISDLEYAKAHLPEEWSGNENLGRVTWGAATAMLGKVYLYDQEWSKAARYFKELIDKADDDGLYALVDNYMDNFTTEGEFNSESIFEVAFSDNYKEGITGDRQDDVGSVLGSEATSIADDFASIYVGGFNTCLPTYWLQELFLRGDSMDISNPENDDRFVSERTYATLVVLWERNGIKNWEVKSTNADGSNNYYDYYYKAPLMDAYEDGKVKEKSKANMNYGQGSKVKKYTNWYKLDTEDKSTKARTGINFRHIRLADVYLMYAEAVLEESGTTEEAIKYIDKVRKRAGVVTLENYINTLGGIPQLHVSRYANDLAEYPVEASNESTLLRHIRMVERPLELAFEGHRWYDLVRWGIFADIAEARYAEEQKLMNKMLEYDNASGKMVMKSDVVRTHPLYLTERVRPDWEKPLANYSKERDYFAIPNLETQSNKNLD